VSASDQQPHVIDGGDRRCVMLLLQLRTHLTDLPPDKIVHIISTDPAAPLDLPAWCHLTGHTYLGRVETAAGQRPTYALRVHADARQTNATRPWRSA